MAYTSWAEQFVSIEQERRARTGSSPSRTADLLRREFPEVAAATIAKAELAIQGMMKLPSLPGGERGFVGIPPKWAEPRYNDGEYLWLLNRMEHWLAMLQAGVLTGQDRFGDKVAAELDDWIATVPAPGGDDHTFRAVQERFDRVTPWRMLEVGIRMYRTWSHVPRFFAGTRWFDVDRAGRFAASVRQHAQVLSEYAPILWPNADHNHYMMEMLGLLYAGLMLGGTPNAAAWREQATTELVRCCENQIVEGGGQIEGCPHYHIVCLDVIARAVGGLREHGYPAPRRLLDYMRNGVSYMLQTTRPNAQIVPWGDSDPHTATHGAVLAMWALGEPDALQLISSLSSADEVHDTIGRDAWDVGDVAAMLAAADQPPRSLPPTVAWHKGLDQASARTGWDRNAAFVFFACRSPVNNAHAHIDPAGFDYTALAKPLLVDPGRYTYRNDNDRFRYKTAKTHNTLTIDDREPFKYVWAWEFAEMKRGVLLSVDQHDGRAAMVGEQENFAPVIHRRALTLLPDGVLVVVDRLTNLPAGATVQRWFHFNSTTVRWDTDARCAHSADDVNVAIFTTIDTSGEVLPGTISTAIDAEYASNRLRLQTTTADAVAVIVPYRGPRPTLTDLLLGQTTVAFNLAGQTVSVSLS